jgi:hypothetical protein
MARRVASFLALGLRWRWKHDAIFGEMLTGVLLVRDTLVAPSRIHRGSFLCGADMRCPEAFGTDRKSRQHAFEIEAVT